MKKFILLLLICISPFVQSDEIDCDNAINTYEMNVCAKKEMVAADVALNKALSQAKDKYANEATLLKLLAFSQDAWLIYRKAHCDGVYEKWAGGSIRGVMFGQCMLSLTEQRTQNIWSHYLTDMDYSPTLMPEPM